MILVAGIQPQQDQGLTRSELIAALKTVLLFSTNYLLIKTKH